MTDTKPHMQEAQKASSSDLENSTPRHIIFKLQKTSLERNQRRKNSYLKVNKDKNYSRILFMQSGREWIEIFSVEEKPSCTKFGEFYMHQNYPSKVKEI